MRMDMQSGDVMLMDSRLWHCGGSNVSNGVPSCVQHAASASAGEHREGKCRRLPSSAALSQGQRRCMLVVTFGPRLAHDRPEGSTYSLLPQLEGQHSLRSLRAAEATRPRANVAGTARAEPQHANSVAIGAQMPQPLPPRLLTASMVGPDVQLPLSATRQLYRLASTLPDDDPIVHKVQSRLLEVLDAAERSGAAEPQPSQRSAPAGPRRQPMVVIPAVLIRTLWSYRQTWGAV